MFLWDGTPCLWGYSLSSPSLSAAWISVLGMTSLASITITFQALKASAANGGALIARTLIYKGCHGGRTWTRCLQRKMNHISKGIENGFSAYIPGTPSWTNCKAVWLGESQKQQMAWEFCLKSVDSDQSRSSFLLSPTPAWEGKACSHLCCQAPRCAQSHCLEQGQPCEMPFAQAKRFVSL